MNGTRMGTDYKLGSMVTFHCEAGYLLQGYSTLTCVMGNSKRPEWDRAKPSCQGKKQHFTPNSVFDISLLKEGSYFKVAFIVSW